MTSALPTDLREAVVTACGQAFHYKDTLRTIFVNAGVPEQLFDSHRDLNKYLIARNILQQLDSRGEAGRQAQWAIVRQLRSMRSPLEDAQDQQAGARALRRVQTLAIATGATPEDDGELAARRARNKLKQQARETNAKVLADLAARFTQLAAPDRAGLTKQERGYAFEDLLRDLFELENIEYRRAFRVSDVEQIDGAFVLDGRDYLIEARWRKDAPDANDLYAFAHKISGKVDATRGLFITMVAPRPEVVQALSQVSKQVLIMDGADLAVILQGMRTLRDGLALKAAKAAHEGILFYSLAGASAA